MTIIAGYTGIGKTYFAEHIEGAVELDSLEALRGEMRMSFIYAMGDIHGCLWEFDAALALVDLSGDNVLVLLGDYIHGGYDPRGVLERVMELERRYGPDKVVVLAGNHEDMALSGQRPIAAGLCEEARRDCDSADDRFLSWMQTLRRYYATERQIKNTRYALLKNPENLSDAQKTQLDFLMKAHPKLYRAYLLKRVTKTVHRDVLVDSRCTKPFVQSQIYRVRRDGIQIFPARKEQALRMVRAVLTPVCPQRLKALL